MADIRDTLNDPNTPVWDMLADGGIDLDSVGVSPDGVWVLICGEGHVASRRRRPPKPARRLKAGAGPATGATRT